MDLACPPAEVTRNTGSWDALQTWDQILPGGMDYRFENGRLEIQRAPEEKAEIQRRLRRIEGQVRGLQQMVENDRYCLDVVQQVNAITAALREISLLELSDHLSACTDFAVKANDGNDAVSEMLTVLRAALRQQ